jgi:hypothetical protein
LLKKLRVLDDVCVAMEKHILMKIANWKKQISIVFQQQSVFTLPSTTIIKEQYKVNNIMGEGRYIRYVENKLEFAKLVMQAVRCIS